MLKIIQELLEEHAPPYGLTATMTTTISDDDTPILRIGPQNQPGGYGFHLNGTELKSFGRIANQTKIPGLTGERTNLTYDINDPNFHTHLLTDIQKILKERPGWTFSPQPTRGNRIP